MAARITPSDELLVLHDDLIGALQDRDLASGGIADVEHDGAISERVELFWPQLGFSVRGGRCGTTRSERGHRHRDRCDTSGGAQQRASGQISHGNSLLSLRDSGLPHGELFGAQPVSGWRAMISM